MSDSSQKHSRQVDVSDREELFAVGKNVEHDISHSQYKSELHALKSKFVKLQRHFITHAGRILVLLQGCGSAGKDRSVRRIVAFLLGIYTAVTHWQTVSTDSKRHAWLNLMHRMLAGLHFSNCIKKLAARERNIVFEFTPDCVIMKRLAP